MRRVPWRVCILTRVPIAEDPEPRPHGEEPDPFANLVLDEEFIKGAAVKEQSGRTRMLAARWKKEPPQPAEPWRPPTAEIRRSRFGRKAKRVDPWGNKRRTKRNWQTPIFVLLTIAVVAAALNVNGLHGWYQDNFGTPGGPSAASTAPSPQAAATTAPTSAPPTEDPKTPTVAHPWANSPAVSWSSGADGIQLPQAQPVGVFSQDEVAKQLQQAKDFMVAANLDPAALAGGTPQRALDMLDQKSLTPVQDDLANPREGHDGAFLFSRFNPRTAVPAVNEVRVQGQMTFEGDGENGSLVHADYIFVYAVVPGPERYQPTPSAGAPAPSASGNAQSVSLVALDPSAKVTREIVHRTVDFRFYDPDHFDVEAGKVHLKHWFADRGNNFCGAHDGYLEPEFRGEHRPSGDPSPSPSQSFDPYDRTKPGPGDGQCGTITRS